MKLVPRVRTVAAMVSLAALLPSLATAFSPAKPIPLEQIVASSDAIVVGIARDFDALESERVGRHRTIEVEQWVAPRLSKSKTIQTPATVCGWQCHEELGSSSQPWFVGRRVLWFLGRTRNPMSSGFLIDLEDIRDVEWALQELKSPWIPHVTSTTTYRVVESESHPIEVPEEDPRLIEIGRILETAKAKINGR